MSAQSSLNEIFLIDFSPLIPTYWLYIIAIIAFSIFIIMLISSKKGALFRFVSFAFLLFSLLDPKLKIEQREKLNDIVLVAIDNSSSQKLENRQQETIKAKDELEKILKARPNTQLQTIEITDSEDGTQLFTKINEALEHIPNERLAGIITITDGIIHDITPLNIAHITAPFNALITGREDEFDYRLEFIEAPRFGFIGKDAKATIKLEIDGKSPYPPSPSKMAVIQNGEVILKPTIVPGVPLQINLPIDHAGKNFFELVFENKDRELTIRNNRLNLSVEGIREKLRVLLVSGEPHAGERMWRDLLKADPNVDLVHFTILRPPEKQDDTPSSELSLIPFPTRDLFIKKIKDFDLIIFDRYSNQTYLPPSYFTNMVSYVRGGGAILFAVGPEIIAKNGLLNTALQEIFPAKPIGKVIENPYIPQITQTGKTHPVTKNIEAKEVWGSWLRQIISENKNAKMLKDSQVLMNGAEGAPLLVLSREGKGRVGLFLSDHLWLWSHGYQGGGPYAELIRRTAHWLMKEPELEEETLNISKKGEQIIIERQSLQTSLTDGTLKYPDGKSISFTFKKQDFGIWKAEMPIRNSGLYHAEHDKLVAFLYTGAENIKEFRQVVSTTSMLKPIADNSGGVIKRLYSQGELKLPNIITTYGDRKSSGGDSINLKQNDISTLIGTNSYHLTLGLIWLLILLLPLFATWIRESGRK